GRREGWEYVALNPTRLDRPWVRSGSICVLAGGPISRRATAVAMWCRWRRISHISSSARRPKSSPACSASPRKRTLGADRMFDPISLNEETRPDAEEWQPMLSPTGAKSSNFHHPKLGEPSETWRYCNAAGLLEGYVCRFETVMPDGTPTKEFRPLRYGAL